MLIVYLFQSIQLGGRSGLAPVAVSATLVVLLTLGHTVNSAARRAAQPRCAASLHPDHQHGVSLV